MNQYFTESSRRRTIMMLIRESPYYITQLTSSDQKVCHRSTSPLRLNSNESASRRWTSGPITDRRFLRPLSSE